MNKKIVIQIIMIFLIIIISWLFFFKYFKENNKNVLNLSGTTSAQNKVIKKAETIRSSKSNFISDINYTSSDLLGNKYQITAKKAEIDINDSNIMFLEKIIAYVYIKNSGVIKITSNFGKYNSKNYDTIFSKNVIITYPEHKITGDYLDFSLLNNLGTMSANIVYSSNIANLIADKIEMNLTTKDTIICMTDNNKKVLIKSTN